MNVNSFWLLPHWLKNIWIPLSSTSSSEGLFVEAKFFDDARLLISFGSMIWRLCVNCERYFFKWRVLMWDVDDADNCLNNEKVLILGNMDLKAEIFCILNSSTLPIHVKKSLSIYRFINISIVLFSIVFLYKIKYRKTFLIILLMFILLYSNFISIYFYY